jgi:hypothetical protein
MIRILRIDVLASIAAALLALCVPRAHSQAMTAITATGTNAGPLQVTGSLCMQAVDAKDNPISVSIAGGGFYLKGRPFCQTLTTGALAGSLSVPNPVTDSAPGHGYDIVVYDSTSTLQTDLGAVYGIGGSTWSLDTYVPGATVPTTAAFTFTTGSGVAPMSCTAPALDIRINSGSATISVCSGGVFIAATSSNGGQTPVTGIRYGNNTSADTAATSTQIQTAIGAGVYDAAGAAAAAQAAAIAASDPAGAAATARTTAEAASDPAGTAATDLATAEAYSANASNITSGTLNSARLPSIAYSSLTGPPTLGTAAAQATSYFDLAGAAAAALAAAEAASDPSGAAATDLAAAEAYSANASNITSGTLNAARLPAIPYSSLTGLPMLGTASAQATSYFDLAGAATTAQSNAETYSANAANITSGTLNHARLPTLLSADIPNNAANTSGNAATATALAATPTKCSSGSAPTGVDAQGNAQGCASITSGSGEAAVTGLRYGNNTGADTAATTAQIQTAIGAGVYDASGAAATAQSTAEAASDPSGTAATDLTAAEAYSANASNITSGTLNSARLPSIAYSSLTGLPTLGTAAAQATSYFDLAGAAATAQTAAETASDPSGTAATDLATAEAYSANASNITSGTLNHARLPTLLSGDIPNNAANTSGTAAGLSATLGVGSGGTGETSLTGVRQANGSSADTTATAHYLTLPTICSASGASNAYTCTTSPTFTPAAGDRILLNFATGNTGSSTLAINSGTAYTIYKNGGVNTLISGDIQANHWISAVFDSNSHWQLEGQLGNVTLTSALALSGLATQAADTVIANATGSSAAPTAVAFPTGGTNGCAGATNAIGYNTSTHAFVCNTISSGTITFPATVASATSGGIPYFSSTTAMATSALLTHYGVVYGGGAGGAPVSTAADTTTTHAFFATATAPAFRAIAVGDIPTLNQNTTGTAAGLSGITFSTLTDSSSVTWALASAQVANSTLTLVHTTSTRSLNLTGVVNGGSYVVVFKQDSTGGAAATLGTGCTWYQGGSSGFTALTTLALTTTASAINILAFTYDGTNCYANLR